MSGKGPSEYVGLRRYRQEDDVGNSGVCIMRDMDAKHGTYMIG